MVKDPEAYESVYEPPCRPDWLQQSGTWWRYNEGLRRPTFTRARSLALRAANDRDHIHQW